jgi:hypothetical protein
VMMWIAGRGVGGGIIRHLTVGVKWRMVWG